MSDGLVNHENIVSIAGRIFINFRYADDIVVNAEEEEETDDILTSTDTTCARYNMVIGHDKTEIMINNPGCFQRKIQTRGPMLM